MAVTHGIPIVITIYMSRWVLGGSVCFIQGFVTYIPATAELLLLTVISIYRWYMLLRPFSARSLGGGHARVCCVIIWLISIGNVVSWIVMGMFVYFDPDSICCLPSLLLQTQHNIYLTSLTTVFIITPLLVIVLSNISILYLASQYSAAHNRPSKNAVLTTSCVAWVFIISVVPVMVRNVLSLFNIGMPSWYTVMAIQLYSLNIACNPLIYTVTNLRFRNYLKKLFFEFWIISPDSNVVSTMNYTTSTFVNDNTVNWNWKTVKRQDKPTPILNRNRPICDK